MGCNRAVTSVLIILSISIASQQCQQQHQRHFKELNATSMHVGWKVFYAFWCHCWIGLQGRHNDFVAFTLTRKKRKKRKTQQQQRQQQNKTGEDCHKTMESCKCSNNNNNNYAPVTSNAHANNTEVGVALFVVRNFIGRCWFVRSPGNQKDTIVQDICPGDL